jgi:hypothetical protein
MLKFASLETLPDTRYLHATGNLADTNERVVVSFGPEHGALEQRQVEMAMREADELFPRPKMIVFTAFVLDPEAPRGGFGRWCCDVVYEMAKMHDVISSHGEWGQAPDDLALPGR